VNPSEADATDMFPGRLAVVVVGICGTLPLLYAQTSSTPGSHDKLSLEEGALTEANHLTFSLGKREEVRCMQ